MRELCRAYRKDDRYRWPMLKVIWPGLVFWIFSLFFLGSAPTRAQDVWPDLSSPPKAVGGGEKDAAVIVGVENYFTVERIPGAQRNVNDWQAFLTGTLRIPAEKVTLLRDSEATLENMRK